MRAALAAVLALTLTTVPALAEARSRASSSSGPSSSYHYHPSTGSSHHYRPGSNSHRTHVATSPSYVRRDANGKILRDPAQRAAFRQNHPCPSTGKTRGACPGYEVDHIKPLACGGADEPGNMQWLTKEANRAKGSEGCRR